MLWPAAALWYCVQVCSMHNSLVLIVPCVQCTTAIAFIMPDPCRRMFLIRVANAALVRDDADCRTAVEPHPPSKLSRAILLTGFRNHRLVLIYGLADPLRRESSCHAPDAQLSLAYSDQFDATIVNPDILYPPLVPWVTHSIIIHLDVGSATCSHAYLCTVLRNDCSNSDLPWVLRGKAGEVVRRSDTFFSIITNHD